MSVDDDWAPIEIRGLTKCFGTVRALDGLDLTVRRGECTASSGPTAPASRQRFGSCWGLTPRFTPVAWGVLVGFVALYLLGSSSGFSQWLLDMEPFAHVPRVGGGDFTAVPLLWLLIIDTALMALGVMAFRRRDLRC